MFVVSEEKCKMEFAAIYGIYECDEVDGQHSCKDVC